MKCRLDDLFSKWQAVSAILRLLGNMQNLPDGVCHFDLKNWKGEG